MNDMLNVWFITINDDGKLVVSKDRGEDREEILVTDLEHLKGIVKKDILMCSSTLDFPEEYTTDQEVIKLCDQIRG